MTMNTQQMIEYLEGIEFDDEQVYFGADAIERIAYEFDCYCIGFDGDEDGKVMRPPAADEVFYITTGSCNVVYRLKADLLCSEDGVAQATFEANCGMDPFALGRVCDGYLCRGWVNEEGYFEEYSDAPPVWNPVADVDDRQMELPIAA